MSRKPKDESIDRKAIGMRIRQMRKELGMGVRRPMVVKLEQGRFTDISLGVLIKLSMLSKRCLGWIVLGSSR